MTEKRCEACGAPFDCGALHGTCWCAEIALPVETRDALAERYDDCLCPACLAAAAAASAAPSV